MVYVAFSPSARRRSARPLRLFAASARCRSFSSFSALSRCCCVRAAAALREAFLEDPFRVAIASSESSARVDFSAGGDTDHELVRCRFVLSAFLLHSGVSLNPFGISVMIPRCCHSKGGCCSNCLLFAVASTALWPSQGGVRRVAGILPACCKGNQQLLFVVGSVPAVHGRATLCSSVCSSVGRGRGPRALGLSDAIWANVSVLIFAILAAISDLRGVFAVFVERAAARTSAIEGEVN